MTWNRLGATDLTGLRLLVDTADTGSLSAAARAARVAQPSASEALRRLERRLGVTLLVRSPHGSRPTEAGATLVESARRALAALDLVAAEAAGLEATQRRELRVAASYTVAEYVLPARLPPAEELTIALAVVNSDEVVARLRRGDADLGFVEGPIDATGLRARRVARDELVVVVAPTHAWSRVASLTPADLAGMPLLQREPESGTRRTYEHALARLGLTAIAPLGVLSSTQALKAAVRAGVGGAVLSQLAVASELAAGDLVLVEVTDLDLTRDLRAVWLAGKLNALGSALIRAVVIT